MFFLGRVNGFLGKNGSRLDFRRGQILGGVSPEVVKKISKITIFVKKFYEF